MSTSYIPPGHARIRVLRAFEFARERFSPGATLVVADADAARLVREKHVVVVEVPTPPGPETTVACKECGLPVHPVCGHVVQR
jgi:hypothetical protein